MQGAPLRALVCPRDVFFVPSCSRKRLLVNLQRVRRRLALWLGLLLLLRLLLLLVEDWRTVAKKGCCLPIGDDIGDHDRR